VPVMPTRPTAGEPEGINQTVSTGQQVTVTGISGIQMHTSGGSPCRAQWGDGSYFFVLVFTRLKAADFDMRLSNCPSSRCSKRTLPARSVDPSLLLPSTRSSSTRPSGHRQTGQSVVSSSASPSASQSTNTVVYTCALLFELVREGR